MDTTEKMIKRFKFDYSPIGEFKCASKKCIAKTENWFKDGWAIVGLRDFTYESRNINADIPRLPFEETEFARRLLEADGVISKHGHSCALICPQHSAGLAEQVAELRRAHLDKHPSLDGDECDFCSRETSYRISTQRNAA